MPQPKVTSQRKHIPPPMTAQPSRMVQEITLHIQARYPLIYLVSWEESRVIEQVRHIAGEAEHPKAVYTWTETAGLWGNGCEPDVSGKTDPVQILSHIIEASEKGLKQLAEEDGSGALVAKP